jgi:PAS domain S-box-containing protein
VLCSFILTAARSSHLYCVQGACLLVAIAAPWAGNIITISGLNPLPYLNLTPIAFFISGLAFALGLFLFHLLDIMPIAREIVIESMREATIVVDAQNRIVDLNPSARRLLNDKASRAIGRPFTEIFASWPALLASCRDAVEINEKVITSEGWEPRYFGLRISPLYHRNGHLSIIGRIIILQDITTRVQAEKALKESEGRFRNIFSEIPIGMAIVDLEGRLLQVNKAFCEMLGYHEKALLGSKLSSFVHPDDLADDIFLESPALSGGTSSYKVEKRYLTRNHETLWADLTATILRDQKGEPMYGLVMLENIIERKRAKLLEEERHHVAYELHDGLAQVAVSAHQHLQALANHYRPRSSQARHELERALELAQRAVREARRLIAGLRPTVLDDFGLVTALRMHIEAQRNEGWSIIFDEALGPERLPSTIETTLFSVAQEAFTNIRKHAHTTRARLLLERRDSMVRLEVQDWGSGFEPSTLLKACSPGDHVGIRAMQERVELIGGHLLISSQPGAGALIIAEVPVLPLNETSQYDTGSEPGIPSTSDLTNQHLLASNLSDWKESIR